MNQRISGRPRFAVLAWALLLGGCGSPSAPPATLATTVDPADSGTAVVPVARVASAPMAGRAPSRGPRDAFVLLSGGGTPLSNHYSQYLQAQALAGFFARSGPPGATWVFFGIGNRPDEPLRLADAHRTTHRDGLRLESWVPGTLPSNRPATRESFLTALRKEILPLVRDGGTLYLFVGDHGELAKGDPAESAITMWQLKPGAGRGNNWSTDKKEILRVSELRQVLAEGLGQGRVIFCMTQCHSGGFHFLGVPRDVAPPREWFHTWPEWARTRQTPAPLRVAGFTATDEQSIAAGCVADPDPERWVGYERYAPEALLGIDLLTGRPTGPARLSLAAAHEAATLVDRTIDKPRASSEQWLERWAHLVETRLAKESGLTEKTRGAVAAFARAVDTGRVEPGSAGLRAQQEQYRRFTARLAEQNPAAKELIISGTRKQLEDAAKSGGSRGGARGGTNRRGAAAEARTAWTDTLRPAWKAAVLVGDGGPLRGPALTFEKHLLKLEDGGKDFLLNRGDGLLNEIYWNSSYARPQSFNPAQAEAVTRWAAERRARVVEWGRASTDPAVRAAAEKVGPGPTVTAPTTNAAPTPVLISRKTAAERVLFYRRVLAAWEFLVAMEATPALARLEELIALERTPLPVPAT